MKQSEMSKKIAGENPVCIMQIHSGLRGRLNEAGQLMQGWQDFRGGKSRKLDPSLEKQRQKRMRIWRLENKLRGIWRRTVQWFTSRGRSTNVKPTANTAGRSKTAVPSS
jgi:hypothetical protein